MKIYLRNWVILMRIGIDIDNVISDLDKTFLDEFLKEDKNKRNAGIINPTAKHMTEGMFDWTQEEIDEFLINNMERMSMNFELIPQCKYYIDKLKNDGNEIIIITGRDKRIFQNPEKVTKEWLKKNNIYYDELIFKKSPNKIEECKKCRVDIMLDDLAINVKKMRENNINAYLVKTLYNENYSLNMPILNDWEHIYNFIVKMRSGVK